MVINNMALLIGLHKGDVSNAHLCASVKTFSSQGTLQICGVLFSVSLGQFHFSNMRGF